MVQRSYERLIVWQEAFRFCLWIYQITKKFPPDERFGLVSQMRRAAESVSSNIAEGNGRRTVKDKQHFFTIAIASLDEVHSQCRIAQALGYLSEDDYKKADEWTHRISFLLNKLRNYSIPSL